MGGDTDECLSYLYVCEEHLLTQNLTTWYSSLCDSIIIRSRKQGTNLVNTIKLDVLTFAAKNSILSTGTLGGTIFKYRQIPGRDSLKYINEKFWLKNFYAMDTDVK